MKRIFLFFLLFTQQHTKAQPKQWKHTSFSTPKKSKVIYLGEFLKCLDQKVTPWLNILFRTIKTLPGSNQRKKARNAHQRNLLSSQPCSMHVCNIQSLVPMASEATSVPKVTLFNQSINSHAPTHTLVAVMATVWDCGYKLFPHSPSTKAFCLACGHFASDNSVIGFGTSNTKGSTPG